MYVQLLNLSKNDFKHYKHKMNKSNSEKYMASCNGYAIRLDDSCKSLRNAGIESNSELFMNRENQLKRAIWNAVIELEKTKYSFRSKQIEKIKNDLLKALLDDADNLV